MSDPIDAGAPRADAAPTAPFTLTDYIRSAEDAEPVRNDDGSMTVYVRLKRIERYSILPRPRRRRKSRRATKSGGGAHLADAANVRRVRRRISDIQ